MSQPQTLIHTFIYSISKYIMSVCVCYQVTAPSSTTGVTISTSAMGTPGGDVAANQTLFQQVPLLALTSTTTMETHLDIIFMLNHLSALAQIWQNSSLTSALGHRLPPARCNSTTSWWDQVRTTEIKVGCNTADNTKSTMVP